MKKFVCALLVLALIIPSVTVYADDGWISVDDSDSAYVRYVTKDGIVHDHSKDIKDEAGDKATGVTFWNGAHLHKETGHTVTGSTYCELSFSGTGFRYVLQYRGPEKYYGSAVDVYVDGSFYTTVRNINGNNLTSRYVALTVTELPDRAHKVRFYSHDGVRVMFDEFEYLPGKNLDGVDGDMDRSGKFDANDAIYLLYNIYFEKDYPIYQNADFDRSGDKEINDAIYLLYGFYFDSSYPLSCFSGTLKSDGNEISVTAKEYGASIISLKSSGYQYLGKPSPILMPSGFEFPTTFCFEKAVDTENGKAVIFEDGAHGLKFTYFITTTGTDGAPFEIHSEIENISGNEITYQAGSIFTLSPSIANATAWTFAKESGYAEGIKIETTLKSGTGIYKTVLSNGKQATAVTNVFQNHNSNGNIPMMYFDLGSKGVYTALEWTNGRIIAKNAGGNVNISVDMDEVHKAAGAFKTRIPNNSTFVNPTVYFGMYSGNIDAGSNSFKRWYLENKAPKNLFEDEREPLTQMDMQIGYDVAQYGIQSIKWDYGWWSNEKSHNSASWKTLEGSWVVRSDGHLSALSGKSLLDFTKAAKAKGVSLATYILLHSNVDADEKPVTTAGIFNTVSNPQWFSNRKIDSGMGYSADLGNTECVKYLKDALSAFIKNNGVTTWRSDFEPICYYSDKENRHYANGTDVQYWATVGFTEIQEYLKDNIPGFRYECCSSGGSLKDFLVGKYASNFNVDDSANYLSLRASFYDSSYCFHPVQIQQPTDMNRFLIDCGAAHIYPEYDMKYKDAVMQMGFRSMMLSGMHVCKWSGGYSDSFLRTMKSYLTYYNNYVKPMIRKGDLYHILPRPDGVNWDGVMYVDTKGSGDAMVFVFKPSDKVSSTIKIKADGLNPNATYDVKFTDDYYQNFTAKGSELMNGFDVTIEGVGSEIINMEKR